MRIAIWLLFILYIVPIYGVNMENTLLSGEDSPKQLLLINTQLVTRIIKFFD